jgi:hypothetical protein
MRVSTQSTKSAKLRCSQLYQGCKLNNHIPPLRLVMRLPNAEEMLVDKRERMKAISVERMEGAE